MIRTVLTAAVLAMTLSPALANEAQKQADCQLQADLIGAVQKARLDRVRKDDVTQTLIAANPGWPTGVEKALPALTEHVYSFKRRDLRNVDLGAVTKQQCLENWEQIQELKKSMTN